MKMYIVEGYNCKEAISKDVGIISLCLYNVGGIQKFLVLCKDNQKPWSNTNEITDVVSISIKEV